jgi:hypothetical protein
MLVSHNIFYSLSAWPLAGGSEKCMGVGFVVDSVPKCKILKTRRFEEMRLS